MGTELLGGLGQQLWPHQCGGVDAHLVRARTQQPIEVSAAAYPAPDCQWNEHLLGRLRDDVVHSRSVRAAGGDIEKDQLVSALFAVGPGERNRVTGVSKVDEVDTLDDSSVIDVEAGDYTDGKSHLRSASPAATSATSASAAGNENAPA